MRSKEVDEEKIETNTGRRNGKTIETAMILRKEILKLPEGRTYGIRRCKNNIICVIPEEVTLNSAIRYKIALLELEIETLKTLYPKSYMRDDDYKLYLIKIQALNELLEGE